MSPPPPLCRVCPPSHTDGWDEERARRPHRLWCPAQPRDVWCDTRAEAGSTKHDLSIVFRAPLSAARYVVLLTILVEVLSLALSHAGAGAKVGRPSQGGAKAAKKHASRKLGLDEVGPR